MKYSFIFALLAIVAVVNAVPCGKDHNGLSEGPKDHFEGPKGHSEGPKDHSEGPKVHSDDSTTQIQSAGGNRGGSHQDGSLIGVEALNGPINALGVQNMDTKTVMNQEAN